MDPREEDFGVRLLAKAEGEGAGMQQVHRSQELRPPDEEEAPICDADDDAACMLTAITFNTAPPPNPFPVTPLSSARHPPPRDPAALPRLSPLLHRQVPLTPASQISF